jgi:hypothetical protein
MSISCLLALISAIFALNDACASRHESIPLLPCVPLSAIVVTSISGSPLSTPRHHITAPAIGQYFCSVIVIALEPFCFSSVVTEGSRFSSNQSTASSSAGCNITGCRNSPCKRTLSRAAILISFASFSPLLPNEPCSSRSTLT